MSSQFPNDPCGKGWTDSQGGGCPYSTISRHRCQKDKDHPGKHKCGELCGAEK